MSNLTLLFSAALFYAGFQIFSKLAGGKIDAFVVSPLITSVGLFAMIVTLTFVKYYKQSEIIPTTNDGLLYGALAGISIAAFSVFFAKSFQSGINASFSLPIIFGAAILFSSIISIIFLKEQANITSVIGLFIVSFGLILVAYGNK